MNKKGFTLVELIGVITILSVITLIATTTTLSMLKNAKEESYNKQVTSIKLALQNWKMDNPSLLPSEGDSIYLTIGQLKANNYLESNLMNPKTNKMWPNDMVLSITNDNGYQYDIIDDTGTETIKYKGFTPYLSFDNGDAVIVNMNSSYQEPTIYLNKKDGTKEVVNLTPTIISGEENIDTSLTGIYKVKYETEVDNIKIASIQNIIIRPSSDSVYYESILNGAYPVLKDGLIPVTLKDNGEVTYADINTTWYSYKTKKWANAVMLVSSPSKTYHVGDVISENDIRSYFVWIPKYSYQLFNLGNYNSVIETNPDSNFAREIQIRFGLKNTNDATIGECKTPMNEDNTMGLSGESGNCEVGEFMTHPAFISMNSNGLWVGKFETSGSASNLTVKPNVVSYTNLNFASMFTNSYNYDNSATRVLDSHMMKNTEWGAVAYLSHSKYGINKEINMNNNVNTLTGFASAVEQNNYDAIVGSTEDVTRPYNTEIGVTASTTGNITGIYDMSGGIVEYTANYMIDSYAQGGIDAAFINLYGNKYFDAYSNLSHFSGRNYRILGDATGEMGPFYNKKINDSDFKIVNNWYMDDAAFIEATYPYFNRGGDRNFGYLSGQFYFARYTGATDTATFRLVLAPR